MAWVHRIVDGACAYCGPVELRARKDHGKLRMVCPNSSDISTVGSKSAARKKRMEALGEYQGKCESCGDSVPLDTVKVDHDHLTGLPRGYLCHHCNVGLGHFKDSPDRLRAAIDYLARSANMDT